jgi:hypothetical protein
LLVATTIICVWLALIVSGIFGPRPLLLLCIAPFFFCLYLAHRFVSRPIGLAISYFLIHAAACGVSLYFIVQTGDGVERWIRSLPIILLDFPVTFVFVAWEPPGLIFPLYILLVGGLFWAMIGWFIARES